MVYNLLGDLGQALFIRSCHEDVIFTKKSNNVGTAFVQGDSVVGSKLTLHCIAEIRAYWVLFRSTTLDINTRLLDNAAFVCVHVVGRFSKDFSEVGGLRSRGFQL